MENKFYITTSIAYTNSKPHIGYALELVQADVLARYWRKKLGDENVFFLTGTDDHGIKNYNKAKELCIDTKKFVDENIYWFEKLTKELNISNNDFISTSNKEKHWDGAIKLWKEIEKSGDIYKKSYEGLYCVGCEAYVTAKDLVDGKCPIHKKEPEKVQEENYFFKLTKYKTQIKEKILNNEVNIVPVERKNEVLNIVDELEDISFSRPVNKLPWGIPVPGDESQTMYVWCDALSNYISALGYGIEDDKKFKKFWPASVHLIGKDILKFHAVIWPAMLLSAGLELPKNIFVHGYVTSEGQKMSKTLGNVVNPFEVIKDYGQSATRYYLLREISTTSDGDFSEKRFSEIYNSELANQLGNWVNRVFTMLDKYDVKVVKKDINKYLEIYREVDKETEKFNLREALVKLWQVVKFENQLLEKEKPWELAKTDQKRLKEVLEESYNSLLSFNQRLNVFLPDVSKQISNFFDNNESKILFPKK